MFEMPKIVFEKIEEDAQLPEQNLVSDAGYIIKSIETKIIPEKELFTLNTGLKIFDITKGVWGSILSIDELLEKHKIQVIPSIIENNFREEIKITLYNTSNKDYLINTGDCIAKLVFMPLLTLKTEFKND
jgi:dUTP pyrophosphatase